MVVCFWKGPSLGSLFTWKPNAKTLFGTYHFAFHTARSVQFGVCVFVWGRARVRSDGVGVSVSAWGHTIRQAPALISGRIWSDSLRGAIECLCGFRHAQVRVGVSGATPEVVRYAQFGSGFCAGRSDTHRSSLDV